MIRSAYGLSSQPQNSISWTSEIKRRELLAAYQKSTQNWLSTLCMPQLPIYRAAFPQTRHELQLLRHL